MGTHAKPRTRVRTVALGTLAVGAALTGVGLTAAALDPIGPSLADGSAGGDPVDLQASGLGAPVPVADVSTLGVAAPQSAAAPGGRGPLPGTTTPSAPKHARTEPTSPTVVIAPGVPEHVTPQGPTSGGSSATGGGSTGGSDSTGSTGSGSTGNGPGSGSGGVPAASDGASGIAGGGLAALDSSGLSAVAGLLQHAGLPALPTLTGSQSVTSLTALPGTVNQATSTVSSLLGQVTGLL
jgi:hypothetical protein